MNDIGEKKLYLVTQDKFTGYDTYDSMVVCAYNYDEAQLYYPGEGAFGPTWWEDEYYLQLYTDGWAAWPKPDDVAVEYIGDAHKGVDVGVVLASFNAG